MLALVRFILVANVIATAIVVGLETATGFLGLKHSSDYVFCVLILLWGTGVLFFFYPPLGSMGQTDDRAERVADSMVDRTAANEIDSKRFSENTAFCIKLLFAGVPAFVVCVVVSIAT
ncbi:hypothetical protein FCV53_04815 [Vibrio sp. F12]|uniref:hypothetical protein n=1 Tax=Vibrio sp. F12 TaxID=2070776 RepID=UPI0010BDA88B|nr:hypothetical protein [Vibrio sp. F12]TKE93611.1 hypothetical protein FCV53_04815 [Vibrio sp. F12]